MHYIEQNKLAWEEAFDKRHPEWGVNIVPRIQTEAYPFFQKDMILKLKEYDFKGKVLAQFCCNNGRELMSLVHTQQARAGYGFDIAENQIAFANEKAAELGLNCRFVAGNILEIEDEYAQAFDALIITIGALCWFKDLQAFFAVVARCLKPGGVLIINEQHPVANMIGMSGDEGYAPEHPTSMLHSYFDKEWINNEGMYYMVRESYPSQTFINYTHPMSEIVTALLANGLQLKAFQEFDYDISGGFETLSQRGIPLSYILEAVKTA